MGSPYFGIVTWAGTAASKSVTGVGFQPDTVFIKRYDGVENWSAYDAGRGAQKKWPINSTSAQSTDANGLTSFDADGFTVGTSHSASGANYIAFCWARATDIFDRIIYTGNGNNSRTISHSLGQTPRLMFNKDPAGAFDTPTNGGGILWTPATTAYFINAGSSNPSNYNAGPTSSVYTPAIIAYDNNNTAADCTAYMWGDKSGYSKVGTYTGNGNASGPTVTTGFAPTFVLIKLVGTGGWYIVNKVRSPTNTVTTSLQLNSTRAENTTDVSIDLNSDGFQIKSATLLNTNGSSYLYMAFSSPSSLIPPASQMRHMLVR